MSLIYHITDAASWNAERATYQPATMEADGFIHCSGPEQVLGVANTWYHGRSGLLLLTIATDQVRAEIRYENSEGSEELFPHIYGKLNCDAVVAAEVLEPDSSGDFPAPACLRTELK